MTTESGDTVDAAGTELRTVLVSELRMEAEGVLELTLRSADGSDLPAWAPGAHIDVHLASGLIRQYSLCSDPGDPSSYKIAILRELDGLGSTELHTEIAVASTLTIRGPRNHFTLVDSPRYAFIAGGIGITPILPMIRAAEAAGSAWSLAYGGRSTVTMAFKDAFQATVHGRASLYFQDTDGPIDLDSVLDTVDLDTQIYCCGPAGLLMALEQKCAERQLTSRLHIERFTAPLDAGGTPDLPDEPFEADLSRTGITVQVPAGRSLLDVVRDVIPEIGYSCGEGYCGTCEVRVLKGSPDHRDSLAMPDEHDADATMIICVSRAKPGERLTIDL